MGCWDRAMRTHEIDVLYEREIETESDCFMLTAELSIEFESIAPYNGGRSEQSYGADVEFVRCTMRMGRTWVPAPKYIREWAIEWLHGDGRNEAIEKAEDDNQPDPDAEHDQRYDDHDQLQTGYYEKAA